jgi:hypothetical protein
MEPAPCRQLRNEPSGDRPGGLFYYFISPGCPKTDMAVAPARLTTLQPTDNLIVNAWILEARCLSVSFAPSYRCLLLGVTQTSPFKSIAPARAALRGAMEGEDIGV